MKKITCSLAMLLCAMLFIITYTSCSKDSDNGDGPEIDNISPGSGPTGTTVTVTGSNLAAATATVGGISVTVSANTATLLNLIIPGGATAGTQKIVVTNSEGSGEVNFNVTGAGAPPVITAISPASVAIGQPLTITGTGLSNAVVEIATKVSAITANTATSITATVPGGIALGDASVRLTTMLGTIVSSTVIK